MTRPPTARELAQRIIKEPDGERKAKMEELYWVLVAEECGPRNARWWREELDWLRKNR